MGCNNINCLFKDTVKCEVCSRSYKDLFMSKNNLPKEIIDRIKKEEGIE